MILQLFSPAAKPPQQDTGQEYGQRTDHRYKKAVKVQANALQAGYLVSINVEYIPEADSYTVTCNAIADGQLYWWDPEIGDVFNWGPDFKLN